MRAEPNSFIVRPRLAHLLAAVGLVCALLLPATAAGQWKDDRATEEAEEEEVLVDPDYDPADHGLVGRRAYESPQYGYSVDWSRVWEVDDYYDTPVLSDADTGQDTARLIWTSSDGSEAWLAITGQSDNRGGPAEDVAEWTDPEYIAWNWDNPDFEVEVLLDQSSRRTGAVLYSLIDSGNDDALWYIIFQAVELRDGTTIYFQYTIFGEILEDAYDAAGDILLNGDPALHYLEWDDIEAAL